MAAPKEVFETIMQDWSPADKAAAYPYGKGSDATTGMNVIDSAIESGKDLQASFSKGFRTGSDFLKSIAAGVLMPLIPEGDTPTAKSVWNVLRPSMDFLSEESAKRAEKPETVVGRVAGPMAEGVGQIATMPILGGGAAKAGAGMLEKAYQVASPFVTRNVLSGAGMGEGADIGKNVLGGLFGRIDPNLEKTGEAVGSVLGGGAGSLVNISRAKALATGVEELARKPMEAKAAYNAAREKQKLGDERKVWEIMGDEFSNLRASTKGIISELTNEQLANAIGRDIKSMASAEKFKVDQPRSGVSLEVPMPEGIVRPWGLVQQTQNPTMMGIATKQAPDTLKQGVDINILAQARQKSIVTALQKVFGDEPIVGNQAAQAAGGLFNKVTTAKVKALTAEEERIKQTFPVVDSKKEAELGDRARSLRDEKNAASLAVAAKKYDEANKLWDASIETQGMRTEGKDILNEFIAQARPEDVPSVVKNLLSATATKATPTVAPASPQTMARLPGLKGPTPATPDPVTLDLKEANDLSKAFTRMVTKYRQENNFVMAKRATDLKQRLLDAIDQSPASPEAKAAYSEAKRYWSEEHAPRFREAYGRAIGEERGGIWTGRESVESQKILSKAMESETSMREWENLFGNDPQAKAMLSQALEGKFRHDVLRVPKTPEQFEIMLDEFTNNNKHVLDRVPEVAAKIEKQSADTVALMRERRSEIERYDRLMGMPITQKVGPFEAKKFYGRLLADPQKTEEFLSSFPAIKKELAGKMVKEIWLHANPMRAGEYNAEAMIDILGAGSPTKSDPLKASSMQKIFNAAYGEKLGQHHMQTLEAISEMAIREASTNPQLMRAGSLLSESPIRDVTGQSAASHLSNFRAMAMRQASGPYFAALGLSRFANAKVQSAIEKAKLQALYDPATADAILELAKTPSNRFPPGVISAIKKVFGSLTAGDGTKLADKLIDRGFMQQHLVRGAVGGAEQYLNDPQNIPQ